MTDSARIQLLESSLQHLDDELQGFGLTLDALLDSGGVEASWRASVGVLLDSMCSEVQSALRVARGEL